MNIVFGGERGSFGELAAMAFFGPKRLIKGVEDHAAVFKAVASGNADRGVVPIENSLAGSIHQNYDSLLESGCVIVGEILLRVSQCLIANPGVAKRDVRTVYSHPAALSQCTRFLKTLPRATVAAVSNTAGAVKQIKQDRSTDGAAIASRQAAIDFDMHILARNIEDEKDNITRFIIISKKPVKPVKGAAPRKTSIVFSARNIPGALSKCLNIFALCDINLFKIESRPVRGTRFNYLFYLDFNGDARNVVVKKALKNLQNLTTFYRNFGSYPVGREVKPACLKRLHT